MSTLNEHQFGNLPEGLTFQHGGPDELPDAFPFPSPEGEHSVRAHLDGKPIGQISWQTTVNPNAGVSVGRITRAMVRGEYQRRGVATELLRQAREIDPRVHHSRQLSADGKAWTEGLKRKGID